MTTLVLALSVFVGSPLAALQQDGWSETTFHRVYLRNGNFIDGRVMADKPNEVLVQLKVGEIGIRRDQIDRVELIRMRSWNDKAIILDAPKGPVTPKATTPGATTPPAAVDTPEAIRKRVDMIMFKFKNTPGGDDRHIPYVDMAATGEEGSVYLASRIPAFDDKSQAAIAVVLIQLEKVHASDRVKEVLAGQLGDAHSTVRAAAVTVLGSTLDDQGKLKYLRGPMQDEDARVRLLAVASLGNVESKDWYEPIKDSCVDLDPNVRNRALSIAKSLAERHGLSENLGKVMISNTRHPDGGVRADSAALLGALGDKENWRALVSIMNDSEVAVRAAAAQGLMMLGVPESGEEIASALGREKERSVLINLIGAALKVRARKAIEPLIRLLGEADEDVKRLAHSALRSITGQTFEANPNAWTDWWNQNRGQ